MIFYYFGTQKICYGLFIISIKFWGHAECSWLRHYATSRKFAGSFPDEVIGFFNWVDSASNRKEYQESSWGKGRPARKADNITAICELIV
jgi:hypothetical protein